MENNLEKEVKKIIAKVSSKPLKEITLESKVEDLVKDSIELFQLIITFEERFEQHADYKKLMSIETVGDIINYISDSKKA